jgi:ketosteroid isomerase-like protein
VSANENKAVLLAFAERFTRSDWEGVAALMDEDFRWVVPAAAKMQSNSLQAVSGMAANRSKAETLAIYQNTAKGCVDGRFAITIGTMTAEDDRVAAEAESLATSVMTGRVYNNKYQYLIYFRDGKMLEFREYQDTLHAYDVWIAK